MHPAILSATGCALLLSSLVTFVILLWKGRKCKRRSPFYVLSTSDVLSTAATAVALLVSHIESGVKLNYIWQRQNNTYDQSKWTIENGDQLLLSRIRELSEPASEIDSTNATLTCDARHVFTQYGMLLAPLTNALVSLLTLVAQCNLNVACVRRKCEIEHHGETSDTRLEPKRAAAKCREAETPEDRRESTFEQRSARRSSDVIRRIVKFFEFPTLKEDNKVPASLFVISHWLVPFLAIATLYLAEYNDMDAVGRAEDIECAFGSNFPVNDFYLFLDLGAEDDPKTDNPSLHTTSLKHYDYVNGDVSNVSNSDRAQVDQVVAKVQDIVRNVLTYVHNSTEVAAIAASSSGTFGLRNMTEHIVTSNTSQTKNNTSVSGTIPGMMDTTTVRNISIHDVWSNASSGTYFDEAQEVLLFRDLLKKLPGQLNTSVTESSSGSSTLGQNKNDSYDEKEEETTRIYLTSTEGNTIRRTTSAPVQNATFLSDDQIYADIMKRIQVASLHTTMMKKNHYNHLVNRYHGKQPKRKNLEETAGLNPIRDLFFRERDRFANAEDKSGSRMANECLISSKFLKLHLLALSFTLYFLPILLCCILQMRGKNICENTLVMLKTKTDLVSASRILFRDSGNSSEGNGAAVVNEVNDTLRYATMTAKRSQDLSERFDTSQETKDDEGEGTMNATTASDENHQNHVDVPGKELMSRVDQVVRIFGIVRASLILAVFLWTPIFLGTLLKVLSCTRAPQWLTDIAFLTAVSFGIVRNIVNLNIIKIQELGSEDSVRENKIRPVV